MQGRVQSDASGRGQTEQDHERREREGELERKKTERGGEEKRGKVNQERSQGPREDPKESRQDEGKQS